MRIPRMLALGASALVLLSACSTGGSGSPTSAVGGTTAAASAAQSAPQSVAPSLATDVTIKMGSDGFYESKLMAEIYAQVLEAKGFKIDRSGIGLGTRKITAAALESAKIDIKPEYIGSGLAFYDPGKQSGDAAKNQQALQSALSGKGGGITVLNYTPAVDTNAFVVRKETADQYNLKTMSDAGGVATKLKWGVATDCKTNPVCAAALKSQYNIDVSNALPLSACDQPMVNALKAKTIDVGELCSTQPDIAQNGWVLLDDDKHTQPADNLAPLVRNDLLAKVGDQTAFEKILNDVSAKMTTDMLTKLNAQIVFDKQDIAAVAKAWLQQNSLV